MACYARYLIGQFAFRRAIERVLAAGPAPADGWRIAYLPDVRYIEHPWAVMRREVEPGSAVAPRS